jgi:hypothetical protein
MKNTIIITVITFNTKRKPRKISGRNIQNLPPKGNLFQYRLPLPPLAQTNFLRPALILVLPPLHQNRQIIINLRKGNEIRIGNITNITRSVPPITLRINHPFPNPPNMRPPSCLIK